MYEIFIFCTFSLVLNFHVDAERMIVRMRNISASIV